MSVPLAHGLGGIKDLPVPLWLFYYGAALVLVLSFVALWALWKRPLLARASRGRPLPEGLERVLRSPALRVGAGAVSFALFALVATAAFIGDTSPDENLAPRFVLVFFWLGLPALSVLFGNVWTVLSPWRAAADATAWISERTGRRWETPFAYPVGLGRWPGAVLLFAFAALELAYWDPADPRALALAIVLYSAITWLAMLAFGRDEWTENGEAFAVYFGLLARIAPFGRRGDGRLVVRWPFTGLANLDARPGTLAFVAVMLGSVAFDGFGSDRTSGSTSGERSASADRARRRELADVVADAHQRRRPGAVILLVALAYIAAMKIAAGRSHYDGDLTGAFLGSLVPIALAYVVAHYFSFFVRELQWVAPLRLRPLRLRLGPLRNGGCHAEDHRPRAEDDLVRAGRRARDRPRRRPRARARQAVELFESPRKAAISQYAMLALMVVYTLSGLWLLSQ